MGYSFSEDVNFIMKAEDWNKDKLTNLALDCVFASVEIKVCGTYFVTHTGCTKKDLTTTVL